MSGSPPAGREERTGDDSAKADRTLKIITTLGRDVLKARRRVRRRGDGEAIHDLRVATRRLQAALEFAGDRLPERFRRRLERRARALRRSLGEVRNARVLLGLLERGRRRLGRQEARFVSRLASRLERSAEALTFEARRRLPGIRKRIRALREATSGVSLSPAPPVEETMIAYVRGVVHARSVASDGDPESLHRLRIAIKRYRYTLEILQEIGEPGLPQVIEAARTLQAELGRLHDLDVLLEVVRRKARDPGAGTFLRRLTARRLRQSGRVQRCLEDFRPVFVPQGDPGKKTRSAQGRSGSALHLVHPGRTAA